MKRILLDTSAYSNLLGGNEKILDVVSAADDVLISIFVLGELHAGFHGGSKRKENEELLICFLSKPTVKTVNATSETAEVFGEIKAKLKHAGAPIPINDVWIAAHTIETGAALVTFDDHFSKVKGLRTWCPGD